MGQLEFLVIAYAALVFMIVVLVLSIFGRRSDNKARRLGTIEQDESEINAFSELNTSFYSRVFAPIIKQIRGAFSGLLPKLRKKQPKTKSNATLERQLRLSGLYIEPQEYNFIRGIIAVVSILVTLFTALIADIELTAKLMIILGGVAFGIILPILFLRMRISSHQMGIRRQLPDAMDLIGVCMEAGLSFDASLLKINERMSGPFISELMIVYREIQMGRSRREALLNLASGSDIEELKTFASALSQAEQLGIPINNVMRVQSKQLRVTRRQAAQEKGHKAIIKMLIPILIFIFPALFIILMGPTVMNVIEQFS